MTAGEICDDGNRIDGDGCDSNCKPTACGNGVRTAGEACDDSNRVDGDAFRTRSVFAHDFDHDGIPDLAVPGSPIAVFRGAAASPFAEQHSIPVVRDPLQLAACSLDDGGTVGLATRFSDGAVLYPEVAPWQHGSPGLPGIRNKSITPGFWVADLNGDGVSDIMMISC